MDINFNKNEDFNKLLISDLRKRFAQVKLGGEVKNVLTSTVKREK